MKDERMINDRIGQFGVLNTLAGIYNSMHVINLAMDTVFEYSAVQQISQGIDTNTNASAALKRLLTQYTVPEHLAQALEFSDLTTLAARLEGKPFISADFLSVKAGWFRMQFIPMEWETGQVVHVICATQIVDEEKRREQVLRSASYTDGMTGLYNRRAFEEDTAALKDSERLPAAVAMDLNGLKNANDTMGHEAGDELLCGAAQCIQQCMGAYGRVYRTGGDEFAALLYADTAQITAIMEDFTAMQAAWDGKLVHSLAISSGWDDAGATIEDRTRTADQRMYAAKAEYYRSRGIDRRGRQEAMEALKGTYAMIVRVDTQTGRVSAVQPSSVMTGTLAEHVETAIAEGRIHPEDAAMAAEALVIERMHSAFALLCRCRKEDDYCRALIECAPGKADEAFVYIKYLT